MIMDCGDKRPRPASFPTMHSDSFLRDDDLMQVDTPPQLPSSQCSTTTCTVAQVDVSPPSTTTNSLSRPHGQAPGSRQRHGSLPVPSVSQPLSFGMASHEHPPMTSMNSAFWPKPMASTCPVTPLNLMTTAANAKPLSPRAVRRRPSKSKTKRLKYHEYRPPQQGGTKPQPSAQSSVSVDSSYSFLVQQQTLLLQWQLMNQIGGQTPNSFALPLAVQNQQQQKPLQSNQQQNQQQLILPAPPHLSELKKKKEQQFFPTLPPSAALVATPANHVTIDSLMDLQKMSINELRNELLKHNLPVSGKKAILIDRLKQYRDGQRLPNFPIPSPMDTETMWQGPTSPPSADESGAKRDRPPSAPPLLDAASASTTNASLADVAYSVPGVNNVVAGQFPLNQKGQSLCRPIAIRPSPVDGAQQHLAALNLLMPQQLQQQQQLLQQLQAQLHQTQQQLEEHKLKRFELENELEQQKQQQQTDPKPVVSPHQQGELHHGEPLQKSHQNSGVRSSSAASPQLDVTNPTSSSPCAISSSRSLDDAAVRGIHPSSVPSPRRQISAPVLSPLATGPACVQQFVQRPSYGPSSPPSKAKVRSSSSAHRLRSVSMPSSPVQSPVGSPRSSHQNLSIIGDGPSLFQPPNSPGTHTHSLSGPSHSRHQSCPESPSGQPVPSATSQLIESSPITSPSNAVLSGSPKCSSMMNLSPSYPYEAGCSSPVQGFAGSLGAAASLPSLSGRPGSRPSSQPCTPPAVRRSMPNQLRSQVDPTTPLMRSSSLTAAEMSPFTQSSPFLSNEVMGALPVQQPRSMSFSGSVSTYEDVTLPPDLSISACGKAGSLDDFLAMLNRESEFNTDTLFSIGNSPTASSFASLTSHSSPPGQLFRSSSATQLFPRTPGEGASEQSLLIVADGTDMSSSLDESLPGNLHSTSSPAAFSPVGGTSNPVTSTGAPMFSGFAGGSKDNLSWLDLSTMGQASQAGAASSASKHSMHGSLSLGQLTSHGVGTHPADNGLDVFAATAGFPPITDQWDFPLS